MKKNLAALLSLSMIILQMAFTVNAAECIEEETGVILERTPAMTFNQPTSGTTINGAEDNVAYVEVNGSGNQVRGSKSVSVADNSVFKIAVALKFNDMVSAKALGNTAVRGTASSAWGNDILFNTDGSVSFFGNRFENVYGSGEWYKVEFRYDLSEHIARVTINNESGNVVLDKGVFVDDSYKLSSVSQVGIAVTKTGTANSTKMYYKDLKVTYLNGFDKSMISNTLVSGVSSANIKLNTADSSTIVFEEGVATVTVTGTTNARKIWLINAFSLENKKIRMTAKLKLNDSVTDKSINIRNAANSEIQAVIFKADGSVKLFDKFAQDLTYRPSDWYKVIFEYDMVTFESRLKIFDEEGGQLLHMSTVDDTNKFTDIARLSIALTKTGEGKASSVSLSDLLIEQIAQLMEEPPKAPVEISENYDFSSDQSGNFVLNSANEGVIKLYDSINQHMALTIPAGADNYTELLKAISDKGTALTGKKYLRSDINIAEASEGGAAINLVRIASGSVRLVTFSQNSGKIVIGNKTVGKYEKNKWYRIHILLDADTKNADIVICDENGTVAAVGEISFSDADLNASSSNYSVSFGIAVGETGTANVTEDTSLYIDNIQIGSTNPQKVEYLGAEAGVSGRIDLTFDGWIKGSSLTITANGEEIEKKHIEMKSPYSIGIIGLDSNTEYNIVVSGQEFYGGDIEANTSVTTQNYDYFIDTPVFTGTDGNEVLSIYSALTFAEDSSVGIGTVSIAVSSKTGTEEKTGKILAAVYSSDGTLINCYSDDLSTGTDVLLENVAVMSDTYIRVYAWDKMTPLKNIHGECEAIGELR